MLPPFGLGRRPGDGQPSARPCAPASGRQSGRSCVFHSRPDGPPSGCPVLDAPASSSPLWCPSRGRGTPERPGHCVPTQERRDETAVAAGAADGPPECLFPLPPGEGRVRDDRATTVARCGVIPPASLTLALSRWEREREAALSPNLSWELVCLRNRVGVIGLQGVSSGGRQVLAGGQVADAAGELAGATPNAARGPAPYGAAE
jgi:hypothetical protein